MRAAKGSTIRVLSDPFVVPHAAAPATLTAAVWRADGTALAAPVVSEVDGSALVTLTAADHLDMLDRLTVQIAATVDALPVTQVVEVDVVGSHWVTVASLRAEPKLSDEVRYPDHLVAQMRDEWEEYVEDQCNRRFVPGYDVDRTTSRGSGRFRLDVDRLRSVRTVIVDGTPAAFTVSGDVVDVTGAGGSSVEIHYEHGPDRPPAKLVREVRKAISRELTRRGAETPNDVISETSADGGPTIRYSTPDPSAQRWTGIMSLDPVISQYHRSVVPVG